MIVAFYGLATGIRTGVLSYDPAKGEAPREPRAGEVRVAIDQATFDAWLAQWKGAGDRHPIQEYINSITGIVPAPSEYAIVQNGVVVNVMGEVDPVVHADIIARETAAVPGALVVKCVGIVPGATYLSGVFTNPVESVIVKRPGVILGN